MIEKAKKAASAEEIMAMAKSEGIPLSEAEAANYYDLLHGTRPLSDDELGCVAGGKGGNSEPPKPDPKIRAGQIVETKLPPDYLGSCVLRIVESKNYDSEYGWRYAVQEVADGSSRQTLMPLEQILMPLEMPQMDTKVVG